MKKILRYIALGVALLMTFFMFCSCKDSGGNKGDDKYLLLVNKTNALEAHYVPEDLVELDSAYTTSSKSIQLNSVAADAVCRMLDAMKRAGIDNVTVTSAYRTYAYQQTLFNRYCAEEREAHPDWTEEQVKQKVLTYSAAPGTSEHQTGLCVDFFTTEMEGLWNYGSETPNNPYDKGFAETDAFEWLKDHAHEYGFILRFPEDKTDVTGYAYESWHYRYVGVEHATKIHERKISFEEYLGANK